MDILLVFNINQHMVIIFLILPNIVNYACQQSSYCFSLCQRWFLLQSLAKFFCHIKDVVSFKGLSNFFVASKRSLANSIIFLGCWSCCSYEVLLMIFVALKTLCFMSFMEIFLSHLVNCGILLISWPFFLGYCLCIFCSFAFDFFVSRMTFLQNLSSFIFHQFSFCFSNQWLHYTTYSLLMYIVFCRWWSLHIDWLLLKLDVMDFANSLFIIYASEGIVDDVDFEESNSNCGYAFNLKTFIM